MRLLGHDEILASLRSREPDTLFLEPLLEEDQIGQSSVDLRLGYDFLVSILTRRAYVPLGERHGPSEGAEAHFQYTRRDVGERFVLYPGQLVLTTTLEYVALPTSVHADLTTRSSYDRLGVSVGTLLKPGFRGAPSLELFNHGNNPVELVVGSRLVQVHLFELGNTMRRDASSKYYGDVRPTISLADQDADLATLERVRNLR